MLLTRKTPKSGLAAIVLGTLFGIATLDTNVQARIRYAPSCNGSAVADFIETHMSKSERGFDSKFEMVYSGDKIIVMRHTRTRAYILRAETTEDPNKVWVYFDSDADKIGPSSTSDGDKRIECILGVKDGQIRGFFDSGTIMDYLQKSYRDLMDSQYPKKPN